MEEGEMMGHLPVPTIQFGFHPETGWTVISRRIRAVLGRDCPQEVKDRFREEVGFDMPDDEAMGEVQLRGKQFTDIEEMTAWLSETIPSMWGWFVGMDEDVPVNCGLEQ